MKNSYLNIHSKFTLWRLACRGSKSVWSKNAFVFTALMKSIAESGFRFPQFPLKKAILLSLN